MIQADELKPAVWRLVSGLLKDPEKPAAGMDRLIEQEAPWRADGPDRESEILLGKVSECARLRAAYQDQHAFGLMTMEELAAKLEELEHAKALVQTELANLSERRRRVEELVRDKEAVIRGLDNLSPEEKSEVYKLLKLEVTPTPEGMEVSGALLYSESLPFEKASLLLPCSDTSSGRSQYFASATAKALPFNSSSVRALPLFAATDPASLYRT